MGNLLHEAQSSSNTGLFQALCRASRHLICRVNVQEDNNELWHVAKTTAKTDYTGSLAADCPASIPASKLGRWSTSKKTNAVT